MSLDQATGLRRLFGQPPHGALAVCGGDSTAVAVRIAVALRALDCRVLVLDRSHGEFAAALDLRARYELAHVFDGDKAIDDVMLHSVGGVTVLPAARGLQRLAIESADWQQALADAVPSLRSRFDLWFVNGMPPGDSAATRVALVLGTSTRAITTAYGQIKVLQRAQGLRDFGVIVQDAESPKVAREVFSCVAGVAERFLAARLEFLGDVKRTAEVPVGAVPDRRPSGESFQNLAATLLGKLRMGPQGHLVTA